MQSYAKESEEFFTGKCHIKNSTDNWRSSLNVLMFKAMLFALVYLSDYLFLLYTTM